MSFYDRWLSGLKGRPMIAWASGVTAAQWTFLADYAPQMGVVPRSVFAGVTFVVCCVLYFINPKNRDWLPAEGLPQDLIRDMINALLQERLPQIAQGLEARVLAAVPKAAPIAPVEAARPAPAVSVPAPAATSLPVPEPDPNRTLSDDEALAAILQSLQTTAVLLQNRMHREGKA